MQRLCHDDPLIAASIQVEGWQAETAAGQDRQSYLMTSENFARPAFAFCQLDAVAGRHQPSREGRSQRYILSYD